MHEKKYLPKILQPYRGHTGALSARATCKSNDEARKCDRSRVKPKTNDFSKYKLLITIDNVCHNTCCGKFALQTLSMVLLSVSSPFLHIEHVPNSIHSLSV